MAVSVTFALPEASPVTGLTGLAASVVLVGVPAGETVYANEPFDDVNAVAFDGRERRVERVAAVRRVRDDRRDARRRVVRAGTEVGRRHR